MERLHSKGFSVIDNIKVSLGLLGFSLTPECSVLDFGCGSGSLVYAFRDLGYDAYGFDIYDCVQYRNETDRAHFKFFDTGNVDVANYKHDDGSYKLPFDDNTFDFIYSITVLEHIMNRKAVLAELARITKPAGVNYHVYPGIEQIIEPHVFVPCATWLQSLWWFRFWAQVGIRNGYQEGWSPQLTAEMNLKYSRTGLNYMSFRQARVDASQFFSSIINGSRENYYYRNLRGDLRSYAKALRAKHPLRVIAGLQRMTTLVAYNKIVR